MAIWIERGKVEIHSVDVGQIKFQLAQAGFYSASLNIGMLKWATF